jgi:serine/threonine-protein kinase RsbT
MNDERRITIVTEVDIVVARQQGRQMAAEMAFPSSAQALIATAISELARNIVTYAGQGEIIISQTSQNGKPGICVIAQDSGPGIADITLAMQDGYSTSHSLGLGLPGAKRLMDEFEIQSEVGKGTVITMKKWSRP